VREGCRRTEGVARCLEVAGAWAQVGDALVWIVWGEESCLMHRSGSVLRGRKGVVAAHSCPPLGTLFLFLFVPS